MPSENRSLDEVLRPEAREALRHLEFNARKVVEGLLHGAHLSRRKGVSTDFDHHKLYQPGDPIKHVDWKVSARHDRTYVKRYTEDTALSVRLVLDRSGSLNQATDGVGVYDQAARLVACLAYLVLRQRDAVGLVMCSASRTLWLPASSTETQMVRILRALVSAGADAADTLDQALGVLLERETRRGVVAMVSDLMFEPEPVRRQVARLQARGHEMMIFQVRDPTAETFPFSRWVQFESLERAGVRYRVDTVPLKRFYLEEYRAFMDDWRKWARRRDVHFVSVRSDETVETALADYLARRAGRTP